MLTFKTVEEIPNPTLWQILKRVVLFRCLFLLLMALSCAVVADHNPGDDVLRFDMRLEESGHCFCLSGHACDPRLIESRSSECAVKQDDSHLLIIPSRIWQFWLEPTTKWDAARFLSLAVDPTLRDPPKDCHPNTSCDFTSSEQAHAFFPMFPFLIQKTALALTFVLPPKLRPPTFEATVALSGILLNMVCTAIGSISLFFWVASLLPPNIPREDRQRLAAVAAQVYGMWNPAYVFFATNYSESLFGALSFLGHATFSSRHLSSLAIVFWTLASFTRSNPMVVRARAGFGRTRTGGAGAPLSATSRVSP